MILRNWVWFRPPHPPTAIDRSEKIIRILVFIAGLIMYRIDKGASFCHVRRISPVIRGIPWVTSGTQKWKGAIPSFIASAITISVDDKKLFKFITNQWPVCRKFIVAAIIRIIDAVACVRKYFVAASVERGLY